MGEYPDILTYIDNMEVWSHTAVWAAFNAVYPLEGWPMDTKYYRFACQHGIVFG